jgi:transposase
MNTTQACTAGPGQRSERLAAGPVVAAGARRQARNDLEAPAGDLMTRRQVASVFRVTLAAVATWARRGRLAEVRDQSGKPRYRRADVEALLRSRLGRRPR